MDDGGCGCRDEEEGGALGIQGEQEEEKNPIYCCCCCCTDCSVVFVAFLHEQATPLEPSGPGVFVADDITALVESALSEQPFPLGLRVVRLLPGAAHPCPQKLNATPFYAFCRKSFY